MHNAIAPKAKVTGYALIRDAMGKPRIDGDPRRLAKELIAMMSAKEFETACEEYDDANAK